MNKLTSLIAKNFATIAKQGDTVGFIGLGNMGSGMARNLKKAGVQLQLFDVNPETRQTFRNEGFDVVDDFTEIGRNPKVNTVITMVPASAHVKGICEGAEGLFSLLKKGSTIIDCSTIGPLAAKELNETARNAGQEFIDAPVSGGIAGAHNGALTFMVGCDDEKTFADVKQLLTPMGQNIFNCQQVAGGQIVKAANNMALAIQMISVTEALSMGKKLGMDPKILSDIMNTATGQCFSVTKYNPCPGVLENVPSANNWEGGFASQLMLKDLGLALDCAASVNATIPLGKHSHEIYTKICENGLGKKDYSVVFDEFHNNRV